MFLIGNDTIYVLLGKIIDIGVGVLCGLGASSVTQYLSCDFCRRTVF